MEDRERENMLDKIFLLEQEIDSLKELLQKAKDEITDICEELDYNEDVKLLRVIEKALKK